MIKKLLLLVISSVSCAAHHDLHLLKKTASAALFRCGEVMIELRNNQDILNSTLPVSAIVNAANEDCLGGGGIDGAISQAGGTELYRARCNLPEINAVRCPTGQARLTIAGDIKNAPLVIHAVGPRCVSKEDLSDREKELLVNAYVNSLMIARDWNKGDYSNHSEFNTIFLTKKITSIAFPPISTGIFNCSVQLSAPHVIKAVLDFITDYPTSGLKHIYFVFYNPGNPADATRAFNYYVDALTSSITGA